MAEGVRQVVTLYPVRKQRDEWWCSVPFSCLFVWGTNYEMVPTQPTQSTNFLRDTLRGLSPREGKIFSSWQIKPHDTLSLGITVEIIKTEGILLKLRLRQHSLASYVTCTKEDLKDEKTQECGTRERVGLKCQSSIFQGFFFRTLKFGSQNSCWAAHNCL